MDPNCHHTVCLFEPDACRRVVIFVLSSLSLSPYPPNLAVAAGPGAPEESIPNLRSHSHHRFFPYPLSSLISSHKKRVRLPATHLGLGGRPCCWFRSRGEGAEGVEQVRSVCVFFCGFVGQKLREHFPLHLLTLGIKSMPP